MCQNGGIILEGGANMAQLTIRKAERQRTPVRIALSGPAGAGKTWTALSLATVLAEGKRIILIDSENGRSEAYAGEFDFDIIPLPSFSPQTYLEALSLAYEQQPGVVIVDSLSHAWNGPGGALEMVEAIGRRNGNKFNAWGDVTPWQNRLMNAISATPCHIIVTMRAKVEHSQEKDASGKTVIRKLGLFPIQRDGVEYEFDIYGMMDRDHRWTIEKSICQQIPVNAIYDEPGKDIAQEILSWWKEGKEATQAPTPVESVPPPIPQAAAQPRQTPAPRQEAPAQPSRKNAPAESAPSEADNDPAAAFVEQFVKDNDIGRIAMKSFREREQIPSDYKALAHALTNPEKAAHCLVLSWVMKRQSTILQVIKVMSNRHFETYEAMWKYIQESDEHALLQELRTA
jgi:pyruvate/2-oxoglutarate dehydrogenase complex dihydrolipoamide acyltransferase (E2) component